MSLGNCGSILVVEDDAPTRALICAVLEDENRVSVSFDGQTALRTIASEMPDLILMDIGLPDMDGIEVCRRVKANPHTAEIPVIFLTSRTSAADELSGLDVGGIDYIRKPIDPQIMSLRVRAHLKSRMYSRAARRPADPAAVNGHYPGSAADSPDHALPIAGALTAKELECLEWTAAGKTAWEIAVITERSRRTVEFHLRNATQKLDAANIVHAVATAIRRGLL